MLLDNNTHEKAGSLLEQGRETFLHQSHGVILVRVLASFPNKMVPNPCADPMRGQALRSSAAPFSCKAFPIKSACGGGWASPNPPQLLLLLALLCCGSICLHKKMCFLNQIDSNPKHLKRLNFGDALNVCIILKDLFCSYQILPFRAYL